MVKRLIREEDGQYNRLLTSDIVGNFKSYAWMILKVIFAKIQV